MSASLVGSEMCIRDRCGVGRFAATASRASTAPRRRAPAGVWGGCAPVSYTHLTLPTICSV
eukprot:7832634-Alexandrium_andersonii.AAC.1